MGGLELGGGVDPEFVAKFAADPLIARKGFGLSPSTCQRAHEQPDEPLSQRELRREALELGDHIRVPPEGDLGLDEIGGDVEALFAKTGLMCRRIGGVAPAFGRRAVPNRERIAERPDGGVEVPASQGIPAASGDIGEAVNIDVVAFDQEPVAPGRLQHQIGVAEPTTQPRHERLEGIRGVERRLLTPQGLDQRALRDRSRDVDREPDEESAQPSTSKVDRALGTGFTGADVEGPEKIDPHVTTIAAAMHDLGSFV